ncbi:MAG: hypothetical protein LBR38_07225, partial [Synergistaceae bacterium]|nr:hypothetical protein [Synergistaceae bacterium]
ADDISERVKGVWNMRMVPISEVQNEIWAEMAREETLKIGRREGRQEGRQEGRREGRQEGRLETAHNMLKGGMSLDDVLRFTGLSREQIAEV